MTGNCARDCLYLHLTVISLARKEAQTGKSLAFPWVLWKAMLCVHGGPNDFCPLLQKTELSRLETDEV